MMANVVATCVASLEKCRNCADCSEIENGESFNYQPKAYSDYWTVRLRLTVKRDADSSSIQVTLGKSDPL